jgi:ubiquinone/menaquinone biosynthesis C-methylase UbiE
MRDESLNTLYQHRFDPDEQARKLAVWKVLCEDFFSQFVDPNDTVLDLGAGFCEFINTIHAANRIAVDANPEIATFAAPGVKAICGKAEELSEIPSNSIDIAFSSNFFEHLPDKKVLSAVVESLHRVIKPNGKLMVMGPNVRYLPGAYWDYYDHHIPLTSRSVDELLFVNGFEVVMNLPRFLPYTIKGKLPAWPWLVKAYLAAKRVTFPLLGKQFFVLARKRPAAGGR